MTPRAPTPSNATLLLSLFLLATPLVACGSEDEGGATEATGGSGGDIMGSGAAPGSGAVPGSGGDMMATGGMGGMDPMNVGGMAMMGTGGMPPPVSGTEPIIPAPAGECPSFVSGTQTIMGLQTEVLAGAPGATPGPLLFNWHGTGGNGRQAMAQLPQSVRSDIEAMGGVVIAPYDNGQVREGADVTVVLGVWYDVADLAYADHIVACAVQNHNIDPRRIYVTGCSAGGLMAGVMSQLRSAYVAAAAPNSGGSLGPVTPADPSRVAAAITMHGGAGDNVVVNFGDTSRTYQGVLTGAGSVMVVECNHNSGHCGAPGPLYESAWEFLKAHPFGIETSPYAGGLPASFPDYCVIQ